MKPVASTDAQWLRGTPHCRTEGSAVYVTLALEPSRVTDTACLAWSAGELHSTTPTIDGSSVTFCVPRSIFEHGTPIRLELIRSAESEIPVFAWTQIPVLEQTILRAEMESGRPVLSAPAFPPMKPLRRSDWIQAVT